MCKKKSCSLEIQSVDLLKCSFYVWFCSCNYTKHTLKEVLEQPCARCFPWCISLVISVIIVQHLCTYGAIQDNKKTAKHMPRYNLFMLLYIQLEWMLIFRQMLKHGLLSLPIVIYRSKISALNLGVTRKNK